MTDDLSIHGDLAETTVPDLVRSIVRSGDTAIMALESADSDATIYFQEGHIVFASSSDRDLGLPELLLRDGDLDLQQYGAASERMVASKQVGAVLCELGYLDPDALIRALERQVTSIVQRAAGFRSGTYGIDFVEQLPEGVPVLQLVADRLLLDGIRSVESWSTIRRGVGHLERMLKQTESASIRSYQLELDADETHVLELLVEPQTVGVVCERSYLSNFVTCRTLWALLSIGMVADAPAGSDERQVAEATEYELEGRVEKYNTLYQTIFGIVFQRVGDHVYDFMDRVVLHLAPPTLPYLSGMSFVNEGRLDFDQLYNNVIASGTVDHRAMVDTILNELLYGWIIEIKQEFGAEMETEVVRLANSLR
jgi:hypothetical protein